MTVPARGLTVGVLAIQGAFEEHVKLLRQAARTLSSEHDHCPTFAFEEVRTSTELSRCDALVIPGGESTTMSLVAARSNLLEPLRDFVKAHRKPVWGTCAGLILLAESANRTKKGGQELIGGLDVRVNRNHFGRQVESFEAELDLPFLRQATKGDPATHVAPFRAIFIRAPVVEKVLQTVEGEQVDEKAREDTVVAPSKEIVAQPGMRKVGGVEVIARLPMKTVKGSNGDGPGEPADEDGDIIAVQQGNVFGTSFHPELTGDARIHVWWLKKVLATVAEGTGLPQNTAI
ncbi:MAG: hypothetical protein M1817_004524 [Caeruleum heppii]|nr:MAG: hypothetical protein M1817_004524 [Caeruleum heppii]